MRLSFEGLDQPVDLVDCAGLLPLLKGVLIDWPFAVRSTCADNEAAPLRVTLTPQGYLIHAPWLDKPLAYADEVDAICGLVAELLVAAVHRRPDRLCLHGAAVEYHGQLVFFPSDHRAGKSTLVTALAALGKHSSVKIFADDVLTLDLESGLAVANGIAPRVRLPLPKFAHPAVEMFVRDHSRLSNHRYAYLVPGSEHQYGRGATAEIAALVCLQRQAGQPPSLVSCTSADMLAQLLRQNFATSPPAAKTFETLRSIVENSSRHVLHYADSSTAAELILAMQAELLPVTTPATQSPERLYRGESIYRTLIDGEGFLVNARGNAIYKLDPLAGAIWQLLEESRTMTEITMIVCQAFPDIEPLRIRDDIDCVVRDMARQGLIDDRDDWGDGAPSPQAQHA